MGGGKKKGEKGEKGEKGGKGGEELCLSEDEIVSPPLTSRRREKERERGRRERREERVVFECYAPIEFEKLRKKFGVEEVLLLLLLLLLLFSYDYYYEL